MEGGSGGQEVKTQQGKECKYTRAKEFLGYTENIISAGTYKRELQKDREVQKGTKGERELKTESECKRLGE